MNTWSTYVMTPLARRIGGGGGENLHEIEVPVLRQDVWWES